VSRELFRISVYFCLASLLAFLAGTLQPLNGQTGMATLSGIVTDPSGAVVPNAQVTLESVQEHAFRHTVTNSTGAYVIPAILPGTYQLVITAPGFEKQTFSNIILTSGQGSTVNARLKVGEATAVVTVTEQSPLLQTTTAAVGSEVTSREVTELPDVARNFTRLLLDLPGASPVGPPDSQNWGIAEDSINPSLYGQRSRDNGYTLDGVPDMEAVFNAQPVYPPPEAIAEMKVQSAMDTGAYGWAAGANINVVTKSGTNQYHGDAWEYLENNALDARSFFQTKLGALRWNQFGFAAGGPLVVPRVLSKKKGWYVFGYYEGVRIRNAATSTLEVPTMAELNGDFSGDSAIYDPYTTTAVNGVETRQPFPGNIIPQGSTTECAPQAACINSSALRIAQSLYPAPNLAAGVIPGANFISNLPTQENPNEWSVRVDHQFGQKNTFFARITEDSNPSTSVSLPSIPSQTTMNADNVEFGITRVISPTFVATARYGLSRTNYDITSQGPSGLATQATTLAIFPAFQGLDLVPPISISGLEGLSEGAQIYGPEYIQTGTLDLRKIVGRHTVSFGGDVIRTTYINNNLTGVCVDFTSAQTSNFSQAGTGFGLASYLLGLPASAGREVGSTAANMWGWAYALYGQDTFQATSKLTLNMGLRWDFAPPMINLGGSATFVYQTGGYVWDMTNPITGAPPNIRRGVDNPDYRNAAPRFGIAYQVTPKTVVRADYGIFYDTFGSNYAQQAQGNRGNWPFAFPQDVSGINTTVPNAFFPDPFPGPAEGSTVPMACERCLNTAVPSTRTPYSQEWTFSTQRQLTPSLMLEAAYVGSHTVKLDGHIVDNTAMYPGLSPIQDRQKWPDFAVNILNMYNVWPSWYDGLTLNFVKRFSRGLSLDANYTWSKAIDYSDSIANSDGSDTADPTRFPNEGTWKGPAGFDVTNRFVASYIYDIPARSQDKWMNAFIGNWQVAGITTLDSGTPYYALLSTDNENIGTSSGVYAEFPNLVGNPTAGSSTPERWFNTSAYQLPTYGTAGDAGKHALYGDGMMNWDLSMSKQFPLFENRAVEFRADFFNLPNSHAFGSPGVLLGTAQFGTVDSTRQGGRTIELALKFHF
jgi:hypothetical protein